MHCEPSFGWSYPPGCSGPPDDPPDEPRPSGNARQRRKALRALVGRCERHGSQRSKYGRCATCDREEAEGEAEMARLQEAWDRGPVPELEE